MSRLRKGRHTVSVRPVSRKQGHRGEVVEAVGSPVDFQVNVQPVSAAEAQALGMAARTLYRVKYFPQEYGGMPWAGGPYSRITWNGVEYDQIGDSLHSTMSSTTGHVKILMKARSSEVK